MHYLYLIAFLVILISFGNILSNFSNEEIYERYRFDKETVYQILEMVKNDIAGVIHTANNSTTISPLMKLLIALYLYANGSFQLVIEDSVGIHKSTTSRIIPRVSIAICNHLNEWVYVNTDGVQVERQKRSCESVAGFPNVIGVMDCTHIRIQGY